MSIQKPDLSSVFCSDIRIYGHTTFDEKGLEKLPQLVSKEKKGEQAPIIVATAYTIKKHKYTSLIVFLTLKKPKERKVHLSFIISTMHGPFPVPLMLKKALDGFKVMDQLVKMGTKIELDVGANFSYPIEGFESVISLPYDTAVPPLEKVEVAGLRINVKKEPDEEYSQIVDLVREGKISHSIRFKKSLSTLNASFITDLLSEASKYSKRLVRKRGKGAKE
jgi:hypothetical protein